jgi:hypothetical protein
MDATYSFAAVGKRGRLAIVKRMLGAVAACVGFAVLAGCGSGTTNTVTVTKTAARTTAASTTPTTGSTTTGTTTGTTTAPVATTSTQATASTPATPPAPAKTVSFRSFRSPTGNLGCVMFTFGGAGARCDIAKRTWSAPPKPSSCPLDYGQGIQVNGSGRGAFVCAGDTALNPTGKPLPYGEASSVGPFTCVSATTGMTCTNNNSRHGFFISVGSYRLF